MKTYRIEVTVQHGVITIEGYLQNPPNADLYVQTYSVDTLDPAVRLGLLELGWSPPTKAFVGIKKFTRTLEERNAEESKETQTEGDASQALQAEPH